MSRTRRSVDAMLVVMVLIWGVNYSVIKRAFAEIGPHPYNAIRMVIASAVFLLALRWASASVRAGRRLSSVFHTAASPTRREWLQLVGLGLVGQFLYQLCFVGGVNGTSVSNSALIIGATPVVVAIASAALGRERITRLHWLGAAVSAFGIYLVVGHGAAFGGTHLTGDLLVMASVSCWAVYSMGAARLIERHSPLFVTGITFVVGTVPYVAVSLPALFAVRWADLSAYVYISVVLSALLALCVSYLIWYTAIQAIGVARTSVYSNLVPIAAMIVAALWLGEPITVIKVSGAAAVLTGLWLTRLGRRAPAAAVCPEE